MEKKKFFTVYRLAVIGLMSAMVFACTFIHIDIPVPLSNKVMIHFGNVMCILTALLFGPVTGGFAAGIGSAIYDLTDPTYAPEFWVTFLMKFAMAFVAGVIAHSGGAQGKQKGRNILAAVCPAQPPTWCCTAARPSSCSGSSWAPCGRRSGRWSSPNAAFRCSMR